jgi:cytokinin riboside 5'-monophosphate phosphoribohydrolase
MGALAQATYEAGGKVTGIMPETLYRISQQTVGELVLVKDMHSRKALMNEKSDAFIALPGGFGTLEELLEVTTWSQLNIHTKPIVCLNTRSYWNGLLDVVRNCVQGERVACH